uniref:Uncharacterized protein n=1 Tax=Acanthochromis polyacanthus TaxID=80966 RepID=A0A3Q1FC07_9TELE
MVLSNCLVIMVKLKMFLSQFASIIQLNGSMFQLSTHSHQSCIEGTPRQCADAEFAPGTNLAGEGFDITKMERKGAFVLNMNQWNHKNNTCTLCSNPYLQAKNQKLPLSVVDWRAKQSCITKVSTKLYKSSESLIMSSSSSVENNWKGSLDFKTIKKGASLMLAGSHSKVAEYSMEKTKNDKFSFATHSMSCEYYSYRVSSTPELHREFKRAVEQLPKIYSAESKDRFYKVIDNFGTHYITKVKLGGSVETTTSIKECLASLQGFSAEEVQMCLEAEASASIGATVKTEAKHCKKDIDKTESKSAFSSTFNDRFTEIKGGHTTEPDLLFSAILLEMGVFVNEGSSWKNQSLTAGRKSDSRDPCVCQCHNDPAVTPDCCPTRKGMAQVTITVQRASGLWGDYFSSTDGYVKVFLGTQRQPLLTPIIYKNNNPHWAYVFNLGSYDLSSGNKVRFEVWDRDSGWDDDLLGKCEQVLTVGSNLEVRDMNHGKLFYKWEVKCAPSLGGNSCMDYKPTPMSPSLKKLYVSRHAHPIPKAILNVFIILWSPQRTESVKEQRFPRP